jgi:cobalamin biosynthesis Mg chelatase CobN
MKSDWKGSAMVTKARNKELKKLRGNAQALWQDQQALLDRASAVLKEARRQANFLTQEEWLPRARDAYSTRLGPYVTLSGDTSRKAAEQATKAYTETILPAVTSAATAAAALAGTARSAIPGAGGAAATKQTASAAKKATDTSKQAAKVAAAVAAAKAVSKAVPKASKAAKTAPKSGGGLGAGGIVGIVLGLVAVGGVGYAVWQTLRADDDLWVADDEAELPPPGIEPTGTEPTV